MQGFDKYGVGAHTAVPTSHMQKALGLKVMLDTAFMPSVLCTCAHIHRV